MRASDLRPIVVIAFECARGAENDANVGVELLDCSNLALQTHIRCDVLQHCRNSLANITGQQPVSQFRMGRFMVHRVKPAGSGAYRADFYTAENIIGYTGKLHEMPTVYFSDPDTGEFGHLTQQHDVKTNVGRQPVDEVLPGWKYVIENELKSDGTVRAGEYAVNIQTGQRIKQVHDSRGQYTDCRRANIDVFAILAQAIWLFPSMKTIKR